MEERRVHEDLKEKCPYCKGPMKRVLKTGWTFCAAGGTHCDYEKGVIGKPGELLTHSVRAAKLSLAVNCYKRIYEDLEMKVFMGEESSWFTKVNFVDENDVFVGYAMGKIAAKMQVGFLPMKLLRAFQRKAGRTRNE